MDNQQLVLGIVRFLHQFFTVVWIGGLAFMVLTMVPALKNELGKTPQTQSLMNVIIRKHRVWVYISIVGLFITGMVLGKANGDFLGFMSFDNLYSSLTTVKHIIIFAMIIIAIFRSTVFGKRNIKMSPKQSKVSMLLLIINFILGLTVLFLSSLVVSI